MGFLVSLLINGLLVYLIAELLPGVAVSSFFTAVIAALLLGIVNFFIRPILTILTLPITILTLGIFLLVINGIMVLLVDALLSGFIVDGLVSAILFAILLAFFNYLTGTLMVRSERD